MTSSLRSLIFELARMWYNPKALLDMMMGKTKSGHEKKGGSVSYATQALSGYCRLTILFMGLIQETYLFL